MSPCGSTGAMVERSRIWQKERDRQQWKKIRASERARVILRSQKGEKRMFARLKLDINGRRRRRVEPCVLGSRRMLIDLQDDGKIRFCQKVPNTMFILRQSTMSDFSETTKSRTLKIGDSLSWQSMLGGFGSRSSLGISGFQLSRKWPLSSATGSLEQSNNMILIQFGLSREIL
ncbi:unnamed protein product [Nesidiocoris tenuis]|uniref:Uncharacterized protein n=1 Tax=Nesidiocoris tenuis TaxID=355587 RepID=A0A6H5H1H4_9HEMI|nr:unnamed protein product [Nesidiocoris tenuis]